jgi:hypothetical protein
VGHGQEEVVERIVDTGYLVGSDQLFQALSRRELAVPIKRMSQNAATKPLIRMLGASAPP